MSWQVLDNLRLQQASSLAYFDVFWLFGVISFALVFLVLLMKRSVAEKGAADRRGVSPRIASSSAKFRVSGALRQRTRNRFDPE